MKVSVFDTYVNKKNGSIMHFDIIVPTGIDVKNVFRFGNEYLKMKGEEGSTLSTKQCQFCHVEHLQAYMEKDIQQRGYFILEMSGC
jgi:hypothetical protein